REAVTEAKQSLSAREREETGLHPYIPQRFAELVAGHLAGRPRNPEFHTALSRPQNVEGDAFARWQSCSVRAHRDPRRLIVTVLFPLGDLDASRLRALAGLVTTFSEDEARLAREQNLVLPSVRQEDLPGLY